ncbi:polyribonucleotide nucleotidyltransferase [Dictyoglomus thermophilum]|uniref:Polyribonucleotide nucleotidyltransferase n=1 Tax=Dictyoglomus thermophilum TaxID=14 RepID=A0A7V3ZHD5_DICTH|nr:polyribonucleotide nucleotidyltransferase [Dictyoglomus thermophilum]TYT22475.1 polyribonucleotide nucleotidyltransferase [Dictyoglomus thermophilum]
MRQVYSFKREFAGKELKIDIGKVAWQATGAAIVQYGETTVLVTVVASEDKKEDVDFFPLTVEYVERLYAAGKIPGGFFKREGKPTEPEILFARLIDRPLRPLFAKDFRNEVQVIVTVLSYDHENSTDIPSIIGASCAIMLAGLPFKGPIGAVRIGWDGNEWYINPSVTLSNSLLLDLVVAGTKDAVLMIEGDGKEVPEEIFLEGIIKAHSAMLDVINFQEEILSQINPTPFNYDPFVVDEKLKRDVLDYVTVDQIRDAIFTPSKSERQKALEDLKKKVIEHFKPIYGEITAQVDEIINQEAKKILSQVVLEEKRRVDGRKLNEIRPVSCEVGVLKRVHGSALFQRGETQVLSVVTLGAGEEQIIESVIESEPKRYIHHYNFPPFSVGEAKPLRGPKRREIGHGALAERALLPLIPKEEEFPYTIRVVSEVLSSNGSTSMASVCGSSLSLMDAGVPIKTHVAGVAMGLIKEGDRFEVLTDIQGLEDALGGMDFKIAGTRNGITAVQLDIKVDGLSYEIIERTLKQAKEARYQILDIMEKTIPQPRPEISPYAPRIMVLEINPSKIGDLIGPSGKNIKKIIEETHTTINIKPEGLVYISAPDQESAEKAAQMVQDYTRDIKEGDIFLGKVIRVTDYGAFVEILPGKIGLLHISKYKTTGTGKNQTREEINLGDEILIKVDSIDSSGRISLTRKDL